MCKINRVPFKIGGTNKISPIKTQNFTSLVDCQCGVLHHPIMLCAPGRLRGFCLCFMHPQVCIDLCVWFLVSSEVHRCVDDATHFLWETHVVRRQCCGGSLKHKQSKTKWQWITEAACSLFSTYRGLLFQWLTQSFSIFVCKEKQCHTYEFQKNNNIFFSDIFVIINLRKLLTRLFTLCLDSAANNTDNWSDQNHHWDGHNDSQRQAKTPGNSGEKKQIHILSPVRQRARENEWCAEWVPGTVTVVLSQSGPRGVWECCGGVDGCCQWRVSLAVVTWNLCTMQEYQINFKSLWKE